MFVYWTLVQYEKNRDFKQKSESNKGRELGVEGKSPRQACPELCGGVYPERSRGTQDKLRRSDAKIAK